MYAFSYSTKRHRKAMDSWLILTLLIFVQTLDLRAATSMQAECLHNDNPNVACVHLNVSLNPLCSQDPDVCIGQASTVVRDGGTKKCREGDRQFGPVSSLVMVATPAPWCHVSGHFYDIHTLWNKTGSNYKLILREDSGGHWVSTVACVYEGNTAKFTGHSFQFHKTQVQVVTEDIGRSESSVADVWTETRLSRTSRFTIYTVYNDSDGKSCEQHYTPLTVDEYRATADWESDDEMVQVNVSWCSQLELEGDEYIVAIGNDNCTTPDRNPPCFLVRNSSRVSVGPFRWSREIDVPVRVYSVATKYCPNPEAREELVHLFQGCGENCCVNSITVPTPSMSATMATASGSGILTTMSSQTSPCFVDAKMPSGDGPEPVSTPGGFHSDVTNTSSSTPISVMQIKDWILIVVASIGGVIFIAATIVLMAIALKCILCGHTSFKSSKQHESKISHRKDGSIRPLEVIVHGGGCTSSQESKLLGSSSGQESHVSTPTSVESTEALLKDPVVLVVYSPCTPDKDQELIRCQFIPKLQSYGIKARSHDFECIKESPSQWLEREISRATVVLCVCNEEFKNDWEGTVSGAHSLPLVQSLKPLIHATVQQNEPLSKYAIVLLNPRDKDCVPTKYLQGDPRQFLMNDIEEIARFVHGIPSHITLSSSSS